MKKQKIKCVSINFICEILQAAIDFIVSIMIAQLLREVISKNIKEITKVGLYGGAILIFLIPLDYLMSFWAKKEIENTKHSLKKSFYETIIDGITNIGSVGEMDTILQNDIENIVKVYSDGIPKFSVSVIISFICGVILFDVNKWLVLIILLIGLIQILPTFLYEKWEDKVYTYTMDKDEEFSNWINEGIKGIRTIKLYEQEKWYINKFFSKCNGVTDAGIKSAKVGVAEDVVTAIIQLLLSYGVYVICGIYVIYFEGDISSTPIIILIAKYLYDTIAGAESAVLILIKSKFAKRRIDKIKRNQVTMSKEDSEYVYRIHKVCKFYGEKLVLNDLSVAIKKSDRVLLIGDNGSGKSTLLNLLMEFENVNSGVIYCGDNKSSFLLQEDAQLPFTVDEIIEEITETDRWDQDVMKECIIQFGINGIRKKYLSECSGGERKKLFLSLALSRISNLLILDEPTNHLDEKSVEILKDKIQAYEGTIIVCSHDSRLQCGWNRVWKMNQGEIYEERNM